MLHFVKSPIGPAAEGAVVWQDSHASEVGMCAPGLPSTIVETVVPTSVPLWQLAQPVLIPVWVIAGLGEAKVVVLLWHDSQVVAVGAVSGM